MSTSGSPQVQIFGTKKCKNTQKAERFFKERRIAIHFVDLKQKGFAKRELERVQSKAGKENMLNPNSKEYDKLGLKYVQHDPIKVLLEHPLAANTPFCRMGNQASAGLAIDEWKGWV